MIQTKQSLEVRGALPTIGGGGTIKISEGIDAVAQRAVEHVVPHDRKKINRLKAAQKDMAA